MNERPPPLLVNQAEWASFFAELGRESDRATAILAAAWIDHLLVRRLAQVFSHGNAEARAQLFGANGPFATFSSKITAAFCAGWLDADVHHDLHLIRKIRNSFAHHVHGLSMRSTPIRRLIESFRVPHREYYDWRSIECAAMPDGLVFYTGGRPDKAGHPLVIPAVFAFRLAASWTIAYLAANLGVRIGVPDDAPFDGPDDAADDSRDA